MPYGILTKTQYHLGTSEYSPFLHNATIGSSFPPFLPLYLLNLKFTLCSTLPSYPSDLCVHCINTHMRSFMCASFPQFARISYSSCLLKQLFQSWKEHRGPSRMKEREGGIESPLHFTKKEPSRRPLSHISEFKRGPSVALAVAS